MTRKTVIAAAAGAALLAAGLKNRSRRTAAGFAPVDQVEAEYQPQRDSYVDGLFTGGYQPIKPNG